LLFITTGDLLCFDLVMLFFMNWEGHLMVKCWDDNLVVLLFDHVFGGFAML